MSKKNQDEAERDKITQAYRKAQTIKELEEAKDKYYIYYGKFLSWELKPIKAVYDNKMKQLNETN